MGWWSAGGKADEVIGDDSADEAANALAELGAPGPQEFLDALAAVLAAHREFAPAGLSMLLSDSRQFTSQVRVGKQEGMAKQDAMGKTLQSGVKAIVRVYRDAFQRQPSLREVLGNFAFILGHEPARYLSDVEGVRVRAIEPALKGAE